MRLLPLFLIIETLTGTALADTTLRIVASNLTSGNYQAYETPGIAILQALQGDVILMQEFNVGGANDNAAVASFVSSTFGPGFTWYREAGAQIPNGVVSRWPILSAGEWDDASVSNRDFAWARIDVPGPIDLYVISVHFLTTPSTSRNAEASQIVNSYLPSLGIPAGSYLVLGGDFNTATRSEACISTLSGWFDTSAPYPLGHNGDPDTNAGRSRPYDWVLATASLDVLEVPTVYGPLSYSNGLVFDTRDYTQTQLNSYFPPAQTSHSAAASMQHMAVVRTFVIPGEVGPRQPETYLNGTQKTTIVGGGGYQELVYNYTTTATWVSPYSAATGQVPYPLTAGEWTGIYHYDYTQTRFTEAVYRTREGL